MKEQILKRISMRLDMYYIKGAELVISKQIEAGRWNVSRTSVVREGLDKVFAEHGITVDDIIKASKEI